ncbi:drug:proton antiporter [Aureimonas pseudogalii]|uniref:Drug:proton antiporter n=1 Tax=Aureimonas pseudogalii TaxID=1744844 RepID=A0A7W6H3U9_9HYPH|nr:drug:proton antiporter [Aureimonas pseudogalii]MBB3997457.1 hypothetical protein [Aureimonas pseudogalii]
MTPYLLFHVDDPQTTGGALAALLEVEPVEASPGFVLFVLAALKLGLWRREEVLPPAARSGENAEFAMGVDGDAAVDRLHARWQAAGVAILQPPTRLDFGYSLTAALPGPLRVRAFHIAADPV